MELTIKTNSGLRLYSNLLNLDNDNPHYLNHKMKHPADILHSAAEKITRALTKFTTSIPLHELDTDSEKEKSIFDYVLALDHFYDQLLLIIKALSKASEKNNKDVTIWLKENNPEAYGKFKDATTKPHNIIRKIANKIKHDTVEVSYLTVGDHKGREIKGFYFSTIVGPDELCGPDPEIHLEYKGGATAFSYDYFQRYTAGYVATCLYHLNKIFFSGKNQKQIENEVLCDYFSKKSTSGKLILPNEYQLDLAFISLEQNTIKIKYPAKEEKDVNSDKITSISPLFKINKRTRSSRNQYPYYQLQNQHTK